MVLGHKPSAHCQHKGARGGGGTIFLIVIHDRVQGRYGSFGFGRRVIFKPVLWLLFVVVMVLWLVTDDILMKTCVRTERFDVDFCLCCFSKTEFGVRVPDGQKDPLVFISPVLILLCVLGVEVVPCSILRKEFLGTRHRRFYYSSGGCSLSIIALCK